MNAPANGPDDVNAQCEALKNTLRETLSPEGIATIAAFLQPATLTKPKTDEQKAAVCELEWFAELLIEMLRRRGIQPPARRAVPVSRNARLGRRRGWFPRPDDGSHTVRISEELDHDQEDYDQG